MTTRNDHRFSLIHSEIGESILMFMVALIGIVLIVLIAY
jgi:uncharacterized protein YqhQ